MTPVPFADDAACLGQDVNVFFPEQGGTVRNAKRICTVCPVTSECLEYALTNDEAFGVWGGLSESERRRLRRRLVKPPDHCRHLQCGERAAMHHGQLCPEHASALTGDLLTRRGLELAARSAE